MILTRCSEQRCEALLETQRLLLPVRCASYASSTKQLALETLGSSFDELSSSFPLKGKVIADLHGVRFEIGGVFDLDRNGQVLLRSPSSVHCVCRRQDRRVAIHDASVSLQIQWSSISGSGSRGEWEVVDLSPSGARFRVGRSLVPPAETTLEATLQLGRSERVECFATLAHQSDGECGVRLSEINGSDTALARAYQAQLFPSLAPRRSFTSTAIEKLFDRSGYLDLRSSCNPSPQWYGASWSDKVSTDVLYRSRDDELLGHVSVTRGYSKAWLGHQLATLRGHDESMECRQALYRYFAVWPRLLGTEPTYLYGYFNRSRPWHQAYFESFVQWTEPSDSVLVKWDRFEAHDEPDCEIKSCDDVYLEEASAEDLASVVARMRQVLPQLAIDAFDLSEAQLNGPLIHPTSLARKYNRFRNVKTVVMDGEKIGFVLCETGSKALSLFNIFNQAQLYLNDRGIELPPENHARVLRAIEAFYTRQEIEVPLIVAPPKTVNVGDGSRLRLAETMGSVIWSKRALRCYEDFVDFRFGEMKATRADAAQTPVA